MKVAILGKGFINWGGGIDFLKNCIHALQCQDNAKMILFLPKEVGVIHSIKEVLRPYKRILGDLAAGKIPKYENIKKRNIYEIRDNFIQEFKEMEVLMYKDSVGDLIDLLHQNQVDVVIPAFVPFEKDFPIPWVGYLYDFQHKYYPKFFSDAEIIARDDAFSNMLNKAKAVIVNAMDVKKDIELFYPEHQAKIFNLPFAPMPRDEWFNLDKVPLDQYHLPKKYFMIANQFWLHKSHATAFEALSILHECGYGEYKIICTGDTNDYRSREYFPQLKDILEKLNIANKVKFLGYIPKLEQIKIMCGATAVIQPTLFEGGPGGGSVYDAVSMGVASIVSDINVNKEIDSKYVTFFNVNSSQDLADKMVESIKAYELYDRKLDENLLKESGMKLRFLYGKKIMESIEYVLLGNHGV